MLNSNQLLDLPEPVVSPGPHRQFHMGPCVYCGRHMVRFGKSGTHRPDKFTREHVFPKSRGLTSPNIIIPVCHECNCAKGNRMPTQQEIFKAVLWQLYRR